MKVSSSLSNINNSNKSPNFKGFVPNKIPIPETVGKIGKLAGDYIGIPEQKLLLASTAFMFHPLIDLKFGDEDTKIDSAIKSGSKALVGGLTGVTIRALFISFFQRFVGFDKDTYRFQKSLFPSIATEIKEKKGLSYAEMQMNKYTTTLGTLFAIIFMMFFSNKNIDVPLTSDLQDFMTGIVKENKTWTRSLNDVMTARKTKFKNSFKNIKNNFSKISAKIKKILQIIGENEKSAIHKESAK